VNASFDRNELDPSTFGIVLGGRFLRPKPVGKGFALGFDSRLASGSGGFRLDARLGNTTRLNA
jgi:hypothetical protein